MTQPQPTTSGMSKWRHMAAIVTSQEQLLPYTHYTQQFKRLGIRRKLAINFIVFALQYAGLAISTLVAPTFPIWFASGAACGLMFMWGKRILPGIWLGSFLAYFFLKTGIALPLICATLFTLQAWLLWWLSYRYITPTTLFYRRSTFIKFILLGAVLTAATSLALEFFSFSILNHPPQSQALLWLQWWLANLNGLLIFSFALIAMDSYFPQLPQLRNRWLILLLTFTPLIALAIILVFCTHLIIITYFALAILLLHIAISIRYGWCGMVASIFFLGLLFSFGALLSAPLFDSNIELQASLLIKLLLLLAVCLGGLITVKH